MKYIINKPNLSQLEKNYALKAIQSTWLSSNGKNTRIFEKKFSKLTKNKFSIAVQSGTSALHLALKSLNVGKDDNVLIPNYTCVSNISTISQCGAKAILVDIEEETFGLDFELVKIAVKKYKPKVLQLVHIYGYPARDTIKIIKLCRLRKIKIIEDTSEALGAKIGIKKVGTFGDINVTSIRSEKMIGVGEGAVVSTNQYNLYSKLLLLASRGAPKRNKNDPYWQKYFVSTEGYNYLMPHLLGSIARGQIERFKKELLPKKIKVGKLYNKIIIKNNLIPGQKYDKKNYPVFWLNSILLFNHHKNTVRKLGNYLKKNKIEVRSGFWPLNLLKNFNSVYITKFNITQKIFEKILILPSSFDLSEKQINYIINKINLFLKKNKYI
jgi:perosamine synthetase